MRGKGRRKERQYEKKPEKGDRWNLFDFIPFYVGMLKVF